MVPVIFVIRHGRTTLNQQGRFRGEIDVPLAPEGLVDSEEAAKELSGEEPKFLITSDRKRAVQTAQVISKNLGVDRTEVPELRAWNLGDFSGKPKNKENIKELDIYVEDPDLQVPGGESLNEFRRRVLPVLAECFEHATRIGLGLVIAHSSVIHELGNQLYGDHKSLVVKPGGIVVVGFDNGIAAERVFKPMRDRGTATVS